MASQRTDTDRQTTRQWRLLRRWWQTLVRPTPPQRTDTVLRVRMVHKVHRVHEVHKVHRMLEVLRVHKELQVLLQD